MKLGKKNLLNIVIVLLVTVFILANVFLVFAIDIDTDAFITVEPNPVGVSQSVLVCYWIQPPPPLTEIESGTLPDVKIEITKPDGSVENVMAPLGAIDSRCGGSFYWSPNMVGTHTFQMSFPGYTSDGGDYYRRSESNIVTLSVQEDPIDFEIEELTCEIPTAEIEDWPMFQNDPQHVGFTVSDAPSEERLLWTCETGGPVLSSPAVAYNKIYVGSNDHNVYAINADDGSVYWKFLTGGSVQSSPAVKDNLLFVGSDDGHIYCLDATTGDQIRSFDTGGEVRSSPVISKDRVIVLSNSGMIYGFDFNDPLSLVWSHPIQGFCEYSSAAVNDGKVYMFSNGRLRCLNEISGDFLWTEPIIGSRFSSPTVSEGKIYFGSDASYIAAVDASDGSRIWSFPTEGPVLSSPAIAYGTLFVGCDDGNLYYLDAETGELPFSWEPPGEKIRSSPAVADNIVFVGSYDHHFYALSNDGSLKWRHSTGGIVFSSPAVAEGRVFVGSNDGMVYAFEKERIPGFPWESIFLGLVLSVIVIYIVKKRKVSISLSK
jgi:outer membrane protein assembly factor BamB